MKRLELIMGRNIPNAGRVSDSMINSFIKEEIIPHFEYGTFIMVRVYGRESLSKPKYFILRLLILKQLQQQYY